MSSPAGPFLLFCGLDFYPIGGWRDFKGSFATKDEAVDRGRSYPSEEGMGVSYVWWHVVDVSVGEIVASSWEAGDE